MPERMPDRMPMKELTFKQNVFKIIESGLQIYILFRNDEKNFQYYKVKQRENDTSKIENLFSTTSEASFYMKSGEIHVFC